MRPFWFSLVALAALCACGRPNPAAMRDAASGKHMSDAELGDPLCGVGWKWSGQRCVHAEEAFGGTTTTSAPSAAPRTPGFVIDDVIPGAGTEAHPGDLVRVHYTGSLADGTVFDSSKSRGAPFEFRLGDGQVIRGFERGIVGMKVGGTRKVTIPPEMGYGRKGSPPQIPPNATLVFELELLDVKSAAPPSGGGGGMGRGGSTRP